MNKKVIFRVLIILPALLLLFAPVVTPAENKADEIEFPQKGLLASMGNLPSSDLSLPLPPGSAPGVTPPITGGLSGIQQNKWQYRVTNNFDKPVQLSASLRQYSATLTRLSSSSVSMRLKPGETKEGDLPAAANAVGCAIVMDRWRFVSR